MLQKKFLEHPGVFQYFFDNHLSVSPDGVFAYVSPSVETLLGYTPEEVIGKPSVSLNHPDDNIRLLETRNAVFIDQATVRFIGRVRHKNGLFRWYETTVEMIRDEAGTLSFNKLGVVGILQIVLRRKKQPPFEFRRVFFRFKDGVVTPE